VAALFVRTEKEKAMIIDKANKPLVKKKRLPAFLEEKVM